MRKITIIIKGSFSEFRDEKGHRMAVIGDDDQGTELLCQECGVSCIIPKKVIDVECEVVERKNRGSCGTCGSTGQIDTSGAVRGSVHEECPDCNNQ